MVYLIYYIIVTNNAVIHLTFFSDDKDLSLVPHSRDIMTHFNYGVVIHRSIDSAVYYSYVMPPYQVHSKDEQTVTVL